MQAPPPHPREAERLTAVRALGLFDSDPEPRFDALTRTACRLFALPVSLVTLVDADRLWFKSRVGLEAREIPRDLGFCGHAIRGAGPFVVEDALQDSRFQDNPLLEELGLRFYAGVALRSDEGLPYGTFCVLGPEPRHLKGPEAEALKDLAALAETALKAGTAQEATTRRAVELALRHSEARYRALAENAPGVIYQFQTWPDGRVAFPFISPGIRQLYGIEPDAWREDPQWALRAILDEDRPSYDEAFEDAVRRRGPFQWQGRSHTSRPGEVIWIRCQSQPSLQPDGSILWDGLLTDLTLVKDQAEALAQQSAFQASLLRAAEAAIISTDLRGLVTTFNAHAESLLGWSAAEVVGKESPALWHDPEEVRARAAALSLELGRPVRPGFEAFAAKPRMGGTDQREWTFLTKDGKRIPVLLGVSGIRDATDTLVGFLGIASDLRELKAREDALRTSEQRYLDMAASVPGLLYQSRVSAEDVPELLYVSDYSQELFGLPPKAILADPQALYRWAHPEDVEALTHSRRESRLSGAPWEHVWRMVMPSGQVKWIRGQARGTLQPDGSRVWNGLMLDLTERIEAELALRDSQARSQALIGALPDMIFLIRRDGTLLEVHAHSEAGLRRPRAQLLGCTFHDLMPKEAADERMALIHRVLATGRMETYETRVEALGGIQDHESRVVPCGPDTVLLIARDITERKTMERMKGEFVSTVSHELRTPLTSIRGALGLLGAGVGGEIPGKGLELLEIARANTERLLRLVNDILDFEKTQAGKLVLDPQILDLAGLVGASVAAASPFAAALDVAYHWVPPEAPAWARVDGTRFQQIMANLLSNAAKYSPVDRAVEVRLRAEGQRWQVEVENLGPPIPASFRPHVFERFAMADATDTRHRGGTGLGLAISHALVQRMGGEIDFTSGPERTCFYLRFPIEPAP